MEEHLDRQTLRKLQLQELKCLKELKRICDENNIKYFLIGGTLIGAVRHKGFIPWDDDIDVGMLRSEYDKFCKICPEKINKELFYFQIPEVEEGNADFEIARIRLNGTHFVQRHRTKLKNSHDGCFIEILPYDDLPPTKFKCDVYHKYFRIMKRVVGCRMNYGYHINNPVKRFVFYSGVFLSRIIPLKILYNQMLNYHLKYFNTDSEKVFLLAGAYNWKKESHLRSTVSEFTTLEFEGESYNVPKNYDLFLKEQYGDYMTLPPVEEQVNKCFVKSIDFGPYTNED